MIKKADEDGDGRINFSQFENMMKEDGEDPAVNADDYRKLDQPQECRDWLLKASTIYVLDPQASLTFYCKRMGMQLLWSSTVKHEGRSIYYLGYCDKNKIPDGTDSEFQAKMKALGSVEMIYKHSEGASHDIVPDTDFEKSEVKDESDRKFDTVAITVKDLYDACQVLKTLGHSFHRPVTRGSMHRVIVKDPDGHMVELLEEGVDYEKADQEPEEEQEEPIEEGELELHEYYDIPE